MGEIRRVLLGITFHARLRTHSLPGILDKVTAIRDHCA
jgi:hypothetical protein